MTSREWGSMIGFIDNERKKHDISASKLDYTNVCPRTTQSRYSSSDRAPVSIDHLFDIMQAVGIRVTMTAEDGTEFNFYNSSNERADLLSEKEEI